jgi:hypothetical protein
LSTPGSIAELERMGKSGAVGVRLNWFRRKELPDVGCPSISDSLPMRA